MPHTRHASRKTFTRFASKNPFQFGLPNVGTGLTQSSDRSPIFLTRANSLLRRQVLGNAAGVKIKTDSFRMQVVPRDAWQNLNLAGKSVLFLIPDDALGDCVGMVLFMRALKVRFPTIQIGVLNSASASDIFALIPDIAIFQLFISSQQLAGFDHVIDLSEMEGWKDIATMPVNPEEALCEAFDIAPIDLPPRALVQKPAMNIGIVPMASSPLRTLPHSLVRQITDLLGADDTEHKITIVLNAYQGVMPAYKEALGQFNSANILIVDGFKTIGDLVRFVGDQDYVVVADSGPAHIAKLFQTPGTGIYSSADARILLGRHRNLLAWQSGFEGPHCAAPCGLAKLRATTDGDIGCMGSLNQPQSELSELPKESNLAIAKTLVTTAPVPCVARLDAESDQILERIKRDLSK
jgi:ADP-heptose:LPS heptosyltransferase